MNSLMSGELLVPGEGFPAILLVTREWSLSSVNSYVTLELPIVGEGDVAGWTLELLGPLFLGVQEFGPSFFCQNSSVFLLH